MVPVSEVGRETGGCIGIRGVWKRQTEIPLWGMSEMTHGPVGN